jgi:hypothetical protein
MSEGERRQENKINIKFMDTIVKLPWYIKDTKENHNLLQQYVKSKFGFYQNDIQSDPSTGGSGGFKFLKSFDGSLLDALQERKRLMDSRSTLDAKFMHYDLYFMDDDGKRSKTQCYVNSDGEIRIW